MLGNSRGLMLICAGLLKRPTQMQAWIEQFTNPSGAKQISKHGVAKYVGMRELLGHLSRHGSNFGG